MIRNPVLKKFKLSSDKQTLAYMHEAMKRQSSAAVKAQPQQPAPVSQKGANKVIGPP